MSKSPRSPKRKTRTLDYAKKVDPVAKRKVVVASSLLAVLGLTSALLLALEPGQMRPEKPGSLMLAVDPALETNVPVSLGRWRYIYIHQSGSPTGNAAALSRGTEGVADHFVIGNGEGSSDGQIEISQRWVNQLAALPPAGANSIDSNCISICLIGDFHTNLPTPSQIEKLKQLTATLQARYRIGADAVWMVNEQGGNRAVEIGRYFPVSAFRAQLVK